MTATYAADAAGHVVLLVLDDGMRTYQATVYDRTGVVAGAGFGARYAETWGPTIMPQRDGFQILEGDGISIARLATYSGTGSAVRMTSLATALKMHAQLDLNGGSVIIAQTGLGSKPPLSVGYPWLLTVQRFDETGQARTSPISVASDSAGSVALLDFAAGVTSTGWTFAMWTTTDVASPPPQDPLWGAWVDPSGKAGPSFGLGLVSGGSTMDVEPLFGGGVAPSVGLPWLYQVHDGATVGLPPGWLDASAHTKLGGVRGDRAYAVLPIGPPEASPPSGCQKEMTVTLVSAGGKTCGTSAFAIPISPLLACSMTYNSMALGRDGTVVIRTLEFGTAADGTEQYRGLARWWPQVLK
jgi:hypothetical protein